MVRRVQGVQQVGIAGVDVSVEAHAPAGVGIDRPVEQQHRQGLPQVDPRRLLALEDLRHPGCRPILVVGQQELRQVERVLDPYAAGAEGAGGGFEEPTTGRIVQIDGVIVRHHELDHPQRVVRARLLDDQIGEGPAIDALPVDRGDVHRAPLEIDELKSVLRQIAGIRLHLGQDVLAQDGRRYGPGRIDLEVAHRRREHRGLAEGRADDHRAIPDRFAIPDHPQVEPGDVDDDEIVIEIAQDPARALHIGANLLDARLDRQVHLLQRDLADDAVDLQAMALLKALDGLL